jgi:DNA-binding XRE family transcriptional regulator
MKSTHSAAYQCLLGRLRQARRDACLTQAEVGRRLGVRQSFVSKVENGERGSIPSRWHSSPPSTASLWRGSSPELKAISPTVRACQRAGPPARHPQAHQLPPAAPAVKLAQEVGKGGSARRPRIMELQARRLATPSARVRLRACHRAGPAAGASQVDITAL